MYLHYSHLCFLLNFFISGQGEALSRDLCCFALCLLRALRPSFTAILLILYFSTASFPLTYKHVQVSLMLNKQKPFLRCNKGKTELTISPHHLWLTVLFCFCPSKLAQILLPNTPPTLCNHVILNLYL